MIHVARHQLPAQDSTALAAWQARVAACQPYDAAIKTAWNRFSRDPLRGRINTALENQCECKCVYCERNEVESIDHYLPKLQFPATAFDWNNFSGACWTCNRNKREPLDYHNGQPVILNPMTEEPSEFLYIDPGTGRMTPALNLNPADDAYIRADRTITQLKLNRRSLLKERAAAAKGLRLALKMYSLVPGPDAEELVLYSLEHAPRSQAVLRQMLRRPLGNDIPLVQCLLTSSNQLRTHLTTLGWI
ncbi:MAG TPA: HNH endonuclease [Symbiobacteriaceae bacterium]|nr:HNH endonuclease [Symbiobacteriaceae bacterium]